MVVAKGNRIANNGTYKVRDPYKQLLTLLLLIGFGLSAWIADLYYLDNLKRHPADWLMTAESESRGNGIWIILGFNLTAIAILLRLKALWNGIKIDFAESIVEIPGGNISPNDFIDFFKPSFLFQYFIRFKIELQDIRQLSESTKVKTTLRHGIVKRKYSHAIHFSGRFGAATVWFRDEGKRDELYAAIRELNAMGEPFLRV